MIRHFIILVFFISSTVLSAQENFNLNFEVWSNTGQFENPDYWDTSNETFFIGTYVPVTKETGAYDGSYAVKLKSTFISPVGSTLIGVITLGEFEVNTYTQKAKVTGGKAYTKRPAKLTGYYKYSPNSTDSCGVLVDLFKYNSSTEKRDTIGSGVLKSGAVANWTYFEILIDYKSVENPDSINIIALSSDTSNILPESTLWLDKLALVEESSVDENELYNSLNIYPNPAHDFINIELQNSINENSTIEFTNILGVQIFKDVVSKNEKYKKTLILKSVSKGIYFLSLKSNNYYLVKKILIK